MNKREFRHCDAYAAKIAALRPIPKETLKSLREYYRVGLTYTSNALEGNSLTESETKVVIEDGLTIGGKPLKDVYEATGHAKAYDFLYDIAKDKPVGESPLGQSIAIGDEGVNAQSHEGVNEGVNLLLTAIRQNPGKRANELATYIGKSVQSVERYVKTLKDAGKIEFRGAPKNGGYFAT